MGGGGSHFWEGGVRGVGEKCLVWSGSQEAGSQEVLSG
jgi:hypothetical protein